MRKEEERETSNGRMDRGRKGERGGEVGGTEGDRQEEEDNEGWNKEEEGVRNGRRV